MLPGLEAISDYGGGCILRGAPFTRDPAESEFAVINFFDSLDPIRRFAGVDYGEDYSTPVFEPEARKLLSRVESFATHYQVRANTAVRHC